MVSNYGGNGTNNVVSVLHNLKRDIIAFAPKTSYTVAQGPIRVKLQDMTGDGRLDVLVASYANGTGQAVTLLRNASSAGTISLTGRVDYATYFFGPHGLVVGDVDGDGIADIVPANYGNLQGSGSTISVLRWAGDTQVNTTVPAGVSAGAHLGDDRGGSGPACRCSRRRPCRSTTSASRRATARSTRRSR